MPRQKKTEHQVDWDKVDVDGLPALTDVEMEAIMARVVDGKSQTEAFLIYKPFAKEWQRKTIWAEASRWFASDKVSAWMVASKRAGWLTAARTIEDHRAEGMSLLEQCRESGNLGAAASIWKELGNLDGHSVDRKEVTHKTEVDASEWLTKLIASENEAERNFGILKAKQWGLDSLIPQAGSQETKH